MNEVDRVESAQPSARKPAKPSRTLILLLIVLAAMLVAFGFDYNARWQASAAHTRLNEYVLSEDEDTGTEELVQITPEVVRQIIGREPSESAGEGRIKTERYSWQGTGRTYYVYVIYNGGVVRDSFLNKESEDEGA